MLSNPDKRARYDQFGHAGMSGAAGGGAGGFGGFGGGGFSMEDIFSQFGDIFGGHFGGGFRSSNGGGGRRVNRGSDIRVRVRLTLAEIANGVTKKLKINKTVACDKCGGSGARDANSYSTCSTCNGTGYVTRVENTFFGRMQTQGVCPTCGGTGKVVTAQCDKCKGEGTLRGQGSWRSRSRPAWARHGPHRHGQGQRRASGRRERRPAGGDRGGAQPRTGA